MHAMTGDLWIPRTMWEKRRQLSAVVHRSMTSGHRVLILSCDDWTTFFGRIDLLADSCNQALASNQIEYMRVTPLLEVGAAGTSDLSRILGEIGFKYRDQVIDLVVVDDVDLMVDMGSLELARASFFALLYALKTRFREIAMFTNPIRFDHELQMMLQMREFLVVHPPYLQNVA